MKKTHDTNQETEVNNSLPNKRGGKRNNRRSKPIVKTTSQSGFRSCNDIKWYAQNPQLLHDAGQITYGQILGLPSDFRMLNMGNLADTRTVIPGIMTLEYIPGIGVSTDINSNINVASRLVYTYIRHANSGSRNYEAPDYMTYLLAVGNAQAFYAFMVRLYGLINHSSVTNRYITRALVNASGGNYDDLVFNMPNFRYYINYFANKINSLAVPKDQYIFDRMTFLPLHVFTDGDDPKSQMYLFNPFGFYSWDGETYETGSALKFNRLRGDDEWLSFDDLKNFGDKLLEALLENEDIGIMSGDTLKAYGPSGIRQVSPISDEFSTPILKDDGVLAQIHNSVSLPYCNMPEEDYSKLDITQDNGALLYQMQFDVGDYTYMKSSYLDCWFKEPDATFNMEATRLVTFVQYDNDNDVYKVITSGSEVIVTYRLFVFTDDGELTNIRFNSFATPKIDAGENYCNTQLMSLISKFDWHPILYYGNVSSDSGPKRLDAIGDLQNYTVINNEVVDRLHNCALQSLFNVFGLYLKTK